MGSDTSSYSARLYSVVLPLPKKLLSTEVSVEPSHSQSISSRSSDSRIKLETIPVPEAAFIVAVTFPNIIYLVALTVGAPVFESIKKAAPLVLSYDSVVPSAYDHPLGASVPLTEVKSVEKVVPRPASEGQAEFY